ncbi:MAG: TonB-dependent receptor, partial [Acidobacteria bacterium]|nr:TonB-dependent receptor [Acidobacteriota bacterium]
IDHNLSDTHRLSGTYTIEKNEGEDGGVAWPENSYIGRNWRKPQSLTLSLTSTLKPTLLNEFRFGYNRMTGYVMSSIDASDGKLAPILNDLAASMSFPKYNSDAPVVISYDDLQFGPILGFQGTMSVSHPYMSRGLMNDTWGGTDNSYNFTDTVTWMKGAHSFKGGVTLKINQAWYSQNGAKSGSGPYIPAIRGGDVSGDFELTRSDLATWGPMNWPGIRSYYTADWIGNPEEHPGLWAGNGNNNQGATVRNMLNFLSGTVNGIGQAFFIVKDGSNYRWNDFAAGETEYINDLRSREFSFFFKDDWRITNDLTLNLGVRYEYFGVPWEASGMTAALAGGSRSIQGNVAPTWMKWLGLDSSTEATRYQFVGPNSDNSDLRPWNRDMNNFAPHVGFSYQLPWWGKGLTTLRGGYSISYSPITNFDNMVGIIATVPGTSNAPDYRINNDRNGYMNLKNVGEILGDKSIVKPSMDVMAQITNMAGAVTVYDDNLRNPYTHSMNLSLTRQLGRAFTVDVRYIGNLSRNLLSGTNLNTPKYMSNGLFKEFETLRANGSATTDAQIPNIAKILENNFMFQLMGQTTAQYILNPEFPNLMDFIAFGNGFTHLANGNYGDCAPGMYVTGFACTLAMYGSFGAGQPGNAVAGSTLPADFIFTNPQLQSATIMTNHGYTNYHSMQAQVTMRPMRGLSFQSTYTWSRNIMDRGVENYETGSRRYYLADQHRSHSLTTYGSYTLPFGANGFFFRDVSGALKKAIEGWGLSWVANISSGAPMSIGGGSSYWGINNPDVIRPDLWDNKGGKVEYKWNPDGSWSHATFFGDRYMKVPDPSCNEIATELQETCRSNRWAIALANDPSTIVIQNAAPGAIGNMTPTSLTGPGRWSFDMAMSKAVEFMEGKTIDFRIDAANIFNHATPSGVADAFNHAARYDVINLPQTDLNNRTMPGYIATKSGHRTFQAKIRIMF